MKTQPLVSIVTACYNGERHVGRCIEKVLEQTYNNVQMIIVNDGSTDKTEEVILSYKERFDARGFKLVYVKQQNQGVGGATNTAIKYIEGEYFALLDADNFYASNYIEDMVSFFQNNPKFSIVRCDGYKVNENNVNVPVRTLSRKHNEHYKENQFENCLFFKNFHFGGAMFRTCDFDAVNPNREIYPSRHGQNWQILLPMLYAYKAGYLDKKLCYVLFREDSVYNAVVRQDATKQYEQKEEYYKLLEDTLNKINMPNEERENYLYKLRIFYSHERLIIATRYNDKQTLEKEFEYLKENNAVTKNDVKWYRMGKNRFSYNLFTCKEKFIASLSKIKRKIVKCK